MNNNHLVTKRWSGFRRSEAWTWTAHCDRRHCRRLRRTTCVGRIFAAATTSKTCAVKAAVAVAADFRCPAAAAGSASAPSSCSACSAWALGIDPRILIGGAEIFTRSRPVADAAAGAAGRRPARRPTSRDNSSPRSLGSTEDVWSDIFRANGQTYRRATAASLFRPDRRRRLRHGAIGDGAVLLSAGQARLPRHLLLPRDGAEIPRLQRQAMRIRAGLRDGA